VAEVAEGAAQGDSAKPDGGNGDGGHDQVIDREEIETLLSRLDEPEARLVRMYHLEGKTYHEISAELGMPENSVGPALSRARAKMRRSAGSEATV
jgi:RNA polymerase sigma-70 factor (ECF subfamily)